MRYPNALLLCAHTIFVSIGLADSCLCSKLGEISAAAQEQTIAREPVAKLDVKSQGASGYFGQREPGSEAIVFAPGIVCHPDQYECSICLSADGRECYYTVRDADWKWIEIRVIRWEDGKWTEPRATSFTDRMSMEPSLADNDQTLFFIRGSGVYRCTRTEEGWSAPEKMPFPVSVKGEYSAHVSDLGNLWVCSHRNGGLGDCEIWKFKPGTSGFENPATDPIINSEKADCTPIPGPDESYLLFHSSREGGAGEADLYITYADGHGGWSPPENLGPLVNTAEIETSPFLSHDYKYLFFIRTPVKGSTSASSSDIYWISMDAVLDRSKIR